MIKFNLLWLVAFKYPPIKTELEMRLYMLVNVCIFESHSHFFILGQLFLFLLKLSLFLWSHPSGLLPSDGKACASSSFCSCCTTSCVKLQQVQPSITAGPVHDPKSCLICPSQKPVTKWIHAVKLELLVLSLHKHTHEVESQQVGAQPECVQTRGPGRRTYQRGLRPGLPVPAWQRGFLLIREFTQSRASPSNCYPQWQTTPFSLSVGLQFTLPPRPRAPAAHSARCHTALLACQQRLYWRINASSADARAQFTYIQTPCAITRLFKCVFLWARTCVCQGRKMCETENNKTEETNSLKAECVGERQETRRDKSLSHVHFMSWWPSAVWDHHF